MRDLPEGMTRELDIEPLVAVPRVKVTGSDGIVKAWGHYGIFVDHVPGMDGLVRDEWIHHVVLTRGLADWHMPCEPRLYEIQEGDVVEIDREAPLPDSGTIGDSDVQKALRARIRELEEENAYLREADAAWKRMASQWQSDLSDAVGGNGR